MSVNGETTTASKYYYFGGRRVAVRLGDTLYYLHSDHLGSTSVATDESGNPITQTYYPFGSMRTSTGTLPTDYTYTGQRYDASSDLLYYGARYYDAALGRFIQPDTIVPGAFNPQALNRYSYGLNNPVKYTDPTGHSAVSGDCQSWDNVCWEDRYYNAQGLFRNANGEYKRQGAPTFRDEGILEQTSGENPAILARPDLVLLFHSVVSELTRLNILDNLGVFLVGAGSSELEVLTSLSRLDAAMVGNDPGSFVDDLSQIFMGWRASDAIACGFGIFCNITFESRVGPLLNKGGTGFAPWFQDPPEAVEAGLGTQVYHFWEFVDLGFKYNRIISAGGDIVHELMERAFNGPGASVQDLRLASMGAVLGEHLQQGTLTPAQAVDWIYWNLTAPYLGF